MLAPEQLVTKIDFMLLCFYALVFVCMQIYENVTFSIY